MSWYLDIIECQAQSCRERLWSLRENITALKQGADKIDQRGLCRLNSDGSFFGNSKPGGTGGIAKDERGQVLFVFANRGYVTNL